MLLRYYLHCSSKGISEDILLDMLKSTERFRVKSIALSLKIRANIRNMLIGKASYLIFLLSGIKISFFTLAPLKARRGRENPFRHQDFSGKECYLKN